MIFRKNIAIFLGLFLLGGLLAQAPIVAETGFTGFYKGRRFVEVRASKSDAHSGLLNNRVAGLYALFSPENVPVALDLNVRTYKTIPQTRI